MKHLRPYKIFEDSEEEDENALIPEGFKYSWNDIYESILYLTDIGFKIDEESAKRYLADEKGKVIKGEYEGGYGYNREYKSNIDKAKNAIYEIRLFKKKEGGKLYKNVSLGGYPSKELNYYLDSDIDGLLAIYEEIASFCARFDKAYHNLTIEHNGYSIWLVASSDVTEDFIGKKLNDELNDKVASKLSSGIYNTFDRLFNRSYTKKFREDFMRAGTLGELQKGTYIKLFNWNSITKGVYNTNSTQFDSNIKGILNEFNNTGEYNLGRYGYKAEFRELKEEDIVGVREQEKANKYLGTKAIIVKFDYNKVFDNIRKELSK
jgi:hypothetical protein